MSMKCMSIKHIDDFCILMYEYWYYRRIELSMILNQIFIEAGGIMRNKIIIGITFSLVLLMSGCASKQTAEINVLATTDLHGVIPYELTSYVKEERKKDKNLTLVDAGDFLIVEKCLVLAWIVILVLGIRILIITLSVTLRHLFQKIWKR